MVCYGLSSPDSMNSEQTRRYGQVDEDESTHVTHLGQMVEYYAKTAANYNQWHCDPANDSSHNYAVREIVSLMKQTGSKTLLDACCGTGRAVRAALDCGFEATGLDASPQLLDIAKREMGIPESRLVLGDATRLPYPDSSFDVCSVLGALHHCARPEAIIMELIRVSRRGIVVSDDGNGLWGGMKQILIRLGMFEPVYRAVFRREPRKHRRMGVSETDGPTYVFSAEEIIPILRPRFRHFRCLTFYRMWNFQVRSYWLPRLFARHCVISVRDKS